MRAQDSENSYELVPAGAELSITADVLRTYPVSMQGPCHGRSGFCAGVRLGMQWCDTGAFKRSPVMEGIAREGVSTRAGPSSKRKRGRQRARRNGRNGRTAIHGGEQPGRGSTPAVADGKGLIEEEQRPHASAEGPRLDRSDRQKQQCPVQQGREERRESACEETSEPLEMSVDELELRGTFRSAPITVKVKRAHTTSFNTKG